MPKGIALHVTAEIARALAYIHDLRDDEVYAPGATLDALLGGGALGRSRPRTAATRARRLCPSAADVAARAGVLASQMLGTDGRGALRAWLEPVRARMGQTEALDDLMGLCLVPVGGEGSARTFTISRAWETPASRQRKRRKAAAARSHKPLYAAAMLTVAFAAMAFAWRTVRNSNAETLLADERGPVATAPRGALPAPVVAEAPTAPTRTPPSAAVAADTPNRGWLRIGGENLVGARVETDGAFAGYAPLELSLPVGGHTIVVTSRSGHLVVRKRVHIGESQTRLLPLRILR